MKKAVYNVLSKFTQCCVHHNHTCVLHTHTHGVLNAYNNQYVCMMELLIG